MRILHWIKQIKWFIQRGRRGWADCDAWSFDSYLCGVIAPALRRLKENNVGCPSEFWDETKKNNECWRWEDVLESMAQGFDAANELNNSGYYRHIPTENGAYRIEVDKERLELLSNKAKDGLGLFAKYFMNLWD